RRPIFGPEVLGRNGFRMTIPGETACGATIFVPRENGLISPDFPDIPHILAGMRHFAPPGVPEMSGATRDALILKLRRQGWTYRQSGGLVGMSPTSAGHALARIAGGRPGRGPRS